MSKILFFILIFFSFLACAESEHFNDEKILDYSIDLGIREILIVGIPSQFEVKVDSSFYCNIYYKGKTISKENKVSFFIPKDSITPIFIEFYNKKTNALFFQDSVYIKTQTIKSLPTPSIDFLPCSECKTKEDISNIESIRLNIKYKGWDINPSLKEYQFSIVKGRTSIESVITKVSNIDNLGNNGYKINDEMKYFLSQLQAGDILKVTNFLVDYPDGSSQKIDSKEILTLDE